MSDLRLEELNAGNIVAANSLTLKPGQEAFIQPLSYSIAEAHVNPFTAWARVVLDGERVVGFIRGNFDAEHPQEEFRSSLWRINVEADEQGRGVGRFATDALAEEAAQRGFTRVTVLWDRGDAGPEQFFLRIGFEPIGETEYGEVIGALALGERD